MIVTILTIDSVDDLNALHRLFEARDREGNGLISLDDFFYKILEINRSFYGESLFELIGLWATTRRPNKSHKNPLIFSV